MLKNNIIKFLIFIFLGAYLGITSIYGQDFDDHIQQDHELRMGDWDYTQNWQYDRDAYLRGETQPLHYRKKYHGPEGIGFDTDEEYYRSSR